MTLHLASYNIHKCVGFDRRRRPDRIISVLASLAADIVVLQEVDYRLGPRPTALPRDLTEGATGLVALPFALGSSSLGWHGQTILVRPEFAVRALRLLELPGLEPRGAVLAELETPAGPVRVVGLHLGLIRRYRKMQLAAIRAALSHRAAMPTAILGDFNEWSHRGGTESLGPEFHVHAPGPSFPATRPVARLDRLALGPGTHLQDAGIHDTPAARAASDHLPMWARIGIGPALPVSGPGG